MKNGLELDAPITPKLTNALAFAIRVIAFGSAFWLVIRAIRWW